MVSFADLISFFQSSDPTFNILLQTAGVALFGILFFFFGSLVHSKDNRKADRFTVTVNGLIFFVLLIFLPSALVYTLIMETGKKVLLNWLLISVLYIAMVILRYSTNEESKNKFTIQKLIKSYRSSFSKRNLFIFGLFLLNFFSILSYYVLVVTTDLPFFLLVFSTIVLLLVFIYSAILYGHEAPLVKVTVKLVGGETINGTLYKWSESLVTIQEKDGKTHIPEDKILMIKSQL